MCSTASIDEDRFAEKADIEVGITSVCSFVMAAAGILLKRTGHDVWQSGVARYVVRAEYNQRYLTTCARKSISFHKDQIRPTSAPANRSERRSAYDRRTFAITEIVQLKAPRTG
jgi:hypothetical protein